MLTEAEIKELQVECTKNIDLIGKEALFSLIKNSYLIKLRPIDLHEYYLKTLSCHTCQNLPSMLINYDKLLKMLKSKLSFKLRSIIEQSIEPSDQKYANELIEDLIENSEIKFPRLIRLFRKNILNDEKIKQLNELNLIRKSICLEMNLFKENFMKNDKSFKYISNILIDYIESSWLEYGHFDFINFKKYLTKIKNEFTVSDLFNDSSICLFDQELVKDFIYMLKDVLNISYGEYKFKKKNNAINLKLAFSEQKQILKKSSLDMKTIEKNVEEINLVSKTDVLEMLLEKLEIFKNSFKIRDIISAYKKHNKNFKLNADVFYNILKANDIWDLNAKQLHALHKLGIIDNKLKEDYFPFIENNTIEEDNEWKELNKKFNSIVLNKDKLPKNNNMKKNNSKEKNEKLNTFEWTSLIQKEKILAFKHFDKIFTKLNRFSTTSRATGSSKMQTENEEAENKLSETTSKVDTSGSESRNLMDKFKNKFKKNKKDKIEKKALKILKNMVKSKLRSSKDLQEKNYLKNIRKSLRSDNRNNVLKIRKLIKNNFKLDLNLNTLGKNEIKKLLEEKGFQEVLMNFFINEEFKSCTVEKFSVAELHDLTNILVLHININSDHNRIPIRFAQNINHFSAVKIYLGETENNQKVSESSSSDGPNQIDTKKESVENENNSEDSSIKPDTSKLILPAISARNSLVDLKSISSKSDKIDELLSSIRSSPLSINLVLHDELSAKQIEDLKSHAESFHSLVNSQSLVKKKSSENLRERKTFSVDNIAIVNNENKKEKKKINKKNKKFDYLDLERRKSSILSKINLTGVHEGNSIIDTAIKGKSYL